MKEVWHMKVGIIGLGDIAQKAYLPVLLMNYPAVEWHLCTRNQEKLEKIGAQYRVEHLHTTIESLLEANIDAAFVHSPTASHAEMVQSLLKAGVHVYVDKPVSEKLEETKALFALAEEKNVLLVTGFNRRFAPMVQKLKQIENKNMMLIQKNRVNSINRPTAYMLYDLFIHPLDTALYLLGENSQITSCKVIENEGTLNRVWIMLETETTSCLVSVNCLAGANEETIEVHSPTGIVKLDNLTELNVLGDGNSQSIQFGDWEDTLTKRGFQPIADAFIKAVMSYGENPVPVESSLLTHEICQQIIDTIESNQ